MTRFLRRLGWLLFAAATVFLLHTLSQQQVDPSNRSLKSPDGRDAVQLRALQEVVGDDPIVLVAFVVRGDLPMLASDREELVGLRAKLAALPGVATIHEAPVCSTASISPSGSCATGRRFEPRRSSPWWCTE